MTYVARSVLARWQCCLLRRRRWRLLSVIMVLSTLFRQSAPGREGPQRHRSAALPLGTMPDIAAAQLPQKPARSISVPGNSQKQLGTFQLDVAWSPQALACHRQPSLPANR